MDWSDYPQNYNKQRKRPNAVKMRLLYIGIIVLIIVVTLGITKL